MTPLLHALPFDLRTDPVTGDAHAYILLGKDRGWSDLRVREGVMESDRVSRFSAISLDPGRRYIRPESDALVSFEANRPLDFVDILGNYRLVVSPTVSVTAFSRVGQGAALFLQSDAGCGVSLEPLPGALLHSSSRPSDFSIEFWLYPAALGDGEQILAWNAGYPRDLRSGTYSLGRSGQRIRCQVLRNRMEWDFTGFFLSPDGNELIDRRLVSQSAIIPERWSHHLVRFDAGTGLLEYLIDGKLEASAYTSKGGREGGAVFVPRPGTDGHLELGGRYAGVLDDFAIHGLHVSTPDLSPFPPSGGRVETRWFDLGSSGASLERVDLDIRTPGLSGYRVFARVLESPWQADVYSLPWRPLDSGKSLGERYVGRYVQLAIELYPGSRGDPSPVLEGISLVVLPDLPPAPPPRVIARPRDGAVELEWRPSPDRDTAGYVVYYGTERGEYFGVSRIGMNSPVDAGFVTKIRIEGLENGRLYWFAVAAYDSPQKKHNGVTDGEPAEYSRAQHTGAYSAEVSARPVRMD